MNKIKSTLTLLSLSLTTSFAQVGQPFIHDPSTIVECEGKYYTFGTGGGGLISEDGWTWQGGAERPGGGAAPDAMKLGDRYLVIYGATGGGLGGGHNGRILTMWNKTLDPKLHVVIDNATGEITMKNDAKDPWKTEYVGKYLQATAGDKATRGAIVFYSAGANLAVEMEAEVVNGEVVVEYADAAKAEDSYSVATIYTFKNVYG
jgi:hypothetical protein